MPIDPKLLDRIRNNDLSLGKGLDLSTQNPKLQAKDIKELCEALSRNTELTSLDVGGNEIGAEGAEALAQNQTLTSLEVGHNKIGAKGAKALAQNQTLTSLIMFVNEIGDEGAKALAQNQTLTSLNVGNNGIGAEGAKVLAQNQMLTSLYVRSNEIGIEGAKALAQNQKLTSLYVSSNRIGAEGAKALAQNQTLTSLDVSGNEIGAKGIKALAQNQTLISLYISGNKIGDEGAKALAQNQMLTSLDVGKNEIGDEGAKTFIQALQSNYSLIMFGYADNKISEANKQTLKQLIERNCSLRDQFHHAAKQGDMDTLQKCLQQGVSLAATGGHENTALHWAVQNKQKAVVQFLLSEMSKRNVEHYRRLSNYAGKTAFALARNSGDQAIIALFQPPSPQLQIKAMEPMQSAMKVSSSDEIKKPFATLEISFHIAQEELKLGKELGRGGFGIVFQGTWRYNDVAIKQLQSTQLSKDALEEFQSEMKIMARLRSPNIVQLYGITDKTPYCMVMEYLPKGDLYNLLHSNEQISWEQRAQMALDIARGLAYLHHENILHRDLKSKNVLLDSTLKAKLADFGLAKIKTESSITSTGKIVGTLAWMAPELFKRKAEYTLKADMYSYGMVVWELSARKIPFEDAKGNQSLIAKWVSEGEREEIPKETPKKLAQLIEASWSQEPEKRPTAAQAIEQLQTEEKSSAASNVTKPSDYRSNFDSTSMDSGYRDNLDSDNNRSRP